MKTRYSAVLIAAVISLLVMSAPVYAADSNIGIYVNGTWYLDLVGNGAWSASTDTMYSFGGGVTGAIPVTGDWTGSGTTKIGIYANGIWYLDLNGNGAWDGTPTDAMYYFGGGVDGAIPVTGDWTGDGKTKIGIYANGIWYLDLNGNGAWDGTPTDAMYSFGGGVTGAIPVTGDWTGSGTTKIGIFVPGPGTWYLDLNGNGAWDGTPTDALYTFGHLIADAIPATGDWTGSGTTKIGVYVPSSGRWYLDLNGNGAWDGTPTDALYTFGGMTGAVPVTGNWLTSTSTSTTNLWTWVSGPTTTNQAGNYGTMGVAATTNIPGARGGAVSWIDKSANFWLFGGNGYDSTGTELTLNDLWQFDGTNWTWVSGANLGLQAGNYGTMGVAATTNIPGSRMYGVSWIDKSGNLWLFGGMGHDSTNAYGVLNDLWKFDGTNWTWVSGSILTGQTGTYGTPGVAATTNIPGARYEAVSWIDNSGNLWLFGGTGDDSTGAYGDLNDLWKFDGTNWTWVSGSNLINQSGTYGTMGTAATTNIPGARSLAVSWIDKSGNFWLFGGNGFDSVGNGDYLNDLWKFDGTNWIWVSGSNLAGQAGTYGTLGVAATTNFPGARGVAVSWIDKNANLWLFGGDGYDSTDAGGDLNDLWKFDGTNWTWVSGSNLANQSGTYGTLGVAATTNIPSARDSAVSWIDNNGSLWLFGGWGYGSIGAHNDLWQYQP